MTARTSNVVCYRRVHCYVICRDAVPDLALDGCAVHDRGLTLEGLETRLLEFGFVAALNQDDRAVIRMRLAAIPDGSLTARVSRRLLRFRDAPAGAAADIRLLASSASAEEKALLAAWAAHARVVAMAAVFKLEINGPPKEHPWGEKSFLLTDRDGNRWEIAQTPSADGMLTNRQ